MRVLAARTVALGFKKLRMESSLTAVAFYERRGLQVLGRDEHELADGVRMACVHMEKHLPNEVNEATRPADGRASRHQG